MRSIVFFLSLLLVCCQLSLNWATNPDEDLAANRIANFESEPSAYVGNVNVMTGTYQEVVQDLVVPGPEPLVIQRAYSSMGLNLGELPIGWYFNHHGVFFKDPHKYSRSLLLGAFRASLPFTSDSKSKDHCSNLFFDLERMGGGFTNCAGRQLSGRTNKKNSWIKCDEMRKECWLYTGSGGRSHYRYIEKLGEDDFYLLQTEYKPNGNKICYEYNYYRIKKIETQNASGKVFASVSFSYPDWNKKCDKRCVKISASNGNEVVYECARAERPHHTPDFFYYLNRVIRPELPPETYAYNFEDDKLLDRKQEAVESKRLPDKRCLLTEYYLKGKHTVGTKFVEVSREEQIYRRVKRQLAPVGTDSKPVQTHAFVYHLDKNMTEVFDAYNNPTFYYYSDDLLLTSIRQNLKRKLKHIPFPLAYRIENFYWGKKGSSDEGNLICRTIAECYNKTFEKSGVIGETTQSIVGCKAYRYDKKGNVLCESLWGNLTGNCSKRAKLHSSTHYPVENGCEHYDIHYKYTDDSFNLLRKETHPNGKVIRYQYKPQTDLMTAKLTSNGQQIVLREFFAYDEDAVLVQTIRDDGLGSDPHDLTNVTERYITRIKPRQAFPIGLPELVEELYLDLSTGKEALLKKIFNQYDHLGHLTQQSFYDKEGQLAYTLFYQYDNQGRVIVEKDALGQTINRKYDDNGNLIFEQGPRFDYYQTFTYDYSNRLIRSEEADSTGQRLATTYRYDLKGNKIAKCDLHGHETRYVYDELNRLIKEISPAVLSEDGQVIHAETSYEYDVMGNKIAVIDPRGFTTRQEYNLRGQPLTVYYSDGTQESFEYTLSGNLAKSIDRKDLMTLYEYDLFDRVTRKSQYAGDMLVSQTTKSYSTFHLLSEVDEAGVTTSYSYDWTGRLVAKKWGEQLINYGYDSMGRQTEEQEWVSSTDYVKKTKVYNALDQVVEEKIVDQTGTLHHCVHYEYLPDGQQSAVTTYGEQGACTTRTTYNLQKQPLKTTDAEGNITVHVYDHHHRNESGQTVLQLITTDPLGHRLLTTYDALNRVVCTERQDAMGACLQKKEIFYDAAGNKGRIKETVFVQDVPKREIVTLATYDCMNRLIHFVESAGDPEMKQTSYTYDKKGHKESIVKPDGSIVWHSYDDLGRLLTFKSSDNSFSYVFEYNSKGLPTVVSDCKNGTKTQRLYDSNGRMIQEQLQNGLKMAYAYDGMGRPIRLHLPDGSGISYVYQGPYLHQVLRLDEKGGVAYKHVYKERDLSGNPLKEVLALSEMSWDHSYNCLGKETSAICPKWQESKFVYNAIGSLLQREVIDSQGTIPCCYQYDQLDQIQEEEGSARHAYSYDSAYNRIAKDEDSYLVNGLNQLMSHGEIQYLYDSCGNCIQKSEPESVCHYAYDGLDRLIGVTQGGKTIRYLYDAFNRRIAKNVDGKVIHYLYAEQNEIGCVENGKMQELRVLGTGKGAEIGAAVAMELGGEVYVPLHDHNGNVTCLLDGQGKVAETYRYTVYGEEEIYDGEGIRLETAMNPWRFSSKRYDSETNWIYFGRRYYDPTIGRWMTPDPLGQEGGPNLYTYVTNNPLTHFDLYGLTGEGNSFIYLFQQLFSWVGGAISLFGRECIPIPIIRDLMIGGGQLCATGSLNNYVPTWREQHSFNGSIGVWDDTKVIDIYVNGIRTSQESVMNRYKNSSEICNDKKVRFTYNAEHGLVSDVLEWLAQRVGIPTHSVGKLTENIREGIESLGGVNGGGRIRLWAHSQGGEMVASLQKILTKEEMAMIDVKTYGSANLFSKGDFGSVTHYVSTRDWVPLMASPLQYMQSCFHHRPEVIFLPCIGNPYFDHSFEGETYHKQYQENIRHIR